MKRFTLRLSMFLSMLLLIGGSFAFADADLMQAKIPFKFVVGDTTLPPGTYTIEQIDPSDPGPLIIQSENGRVAVDFLTEEARTNYLPNRSKLVFDVVDGKDFLTDIWTVGDSLGRQLEPSRAEHRAEVQMAETHRTEVKAQGRLRHRGTGEAHGGR